MSLPLVACRCQLDEGGASCTVRIDVRLDVVPEVWVSVSRPAEPGRRSAVWRLGRWTGLSGARGFAPDRVLQRALESRRWCKEPPTEQRDAVLSILRSVAGEPAVG